MLAAARDQPAANLDFIEADVMTHDFGTTRFDLIVAVATLHHLPLEAALQRFRTLLTPRGVLVVIGLYRPDGLVDRVYAAAGWIASRIMRRGHTLFAQDAPIAPPQETLSVIWATARRCLPGPYLSRLLLFRYLLYWEKMPTDR